MKLWPTPTSDSQLYAGWDVITSIFMYGHLRPLQSHLNSIAPRLMIVSLGIGSLSGVVNFRGRHGVEEEGNWIRGGIIAGREACHCKLTY